MNCLFSSFTFLYRGSQCLIIIFMIISNLQILLLQVIYIKSLFQRLDVFAFSRLQDSRLGEGIRPPINEMYHNDSFHQPDEKSSRVLPTLAPGALHSDLLFPFFKWPLQRVFLLHLKTHQSVSKLEGYCQSALPSQICVLHLSGCLNPTKIAFRVRSRGIELTNILDDLQNRFSGGQRTGFCHPPVESAASNWSNWLSLIQGFCLSEAQGVFL